MSSYEWPIVEQAEDEEKLVRLSILADQDPQNPRTDYDHMAVMVCGHRRYNLGDKQITEAESPLEVIASEENYDVVCSECGESVEQDDDVWTHVRFECDFEGHTARFSGEFTWHCTTHDTYTSDEDEPEKCHKAHEVKEPKLNRPVEIMPLYLYDHSGITISTSSSSFQAFDSVGWDWGLLGFIYLTHEKIKENWSNIEDEDIPEKSAEVMQAEVEEYDQFLRGDIYGFILEKGTRCDQGDIHWETEDSCWGFYGYDHEASGLKDNLPKEYHYLLERL